ncbi:hypothetical protein SKAU_G00411950 [Synaphobranchus kaupii]|uniref:Integrase catalytic domain-containing protein n=1 Tax=Synaphobranchus kaupii TaxID=118154 RepID=A0A9Q1E806_SYNKA|nr:hypothetical protein SKAU_G00411950 [Synaphobranchus kaupii]
MSEEQGGGDFNEMCEHRMPSELVSDNVQPFTLREFEDFLKKNGVRHILSPPYYRPNGAAERYVQTFKKAWTCQEAQAVAPNLRLARFLLTYRKALHTVSERTRAERFLGRQPRIRLTLLKPDTSSVVTKHQLQQKKAHDPPSREFSLNQRVKFIELRSTDQALHILRAQDTRACAEGVSISISSFGNKGGWYPRQQRNRDIPVDETARE